MLSYIRTTNRDDEDRIWYGVAAMNGDRVESRFDGLTTDAGSVRSLIRRLNNDSASLLHFADIIEDYMACPAAF